MVRSINIQNTRNKNIKVKFSPTSIHGSCTTNIKYLYMLPSIVMLRTYAEDLESIADGKLKTLNERVNSVAARVVHLGDQLQSVTAPRARAFEAYQLMVHFNEFLSDQPLESETFTDPDKGYSQAIDAYVEQCQWQSFRGGDIFTDIWNMLQKHDPVINDVFPNPQQVMSKLVLNIYHGKLQGYVRSKLLNASDPELYLSSLYDLFQKIQDLKRDLQARLMQDTRTNYSLLSEEVAINILQETKLAFHRCGVLSSANDLSENVRQILDILMQYLCREHLEYAVDLAVNAIQSNENQGVKDFLNILRQTAAISHLLEKQIDDSVSALLKNSSQSTSCLEHAKSLLETIEAKLDKGVDKMLTTIVGHVRFILTTEQKKQEFKPEEDDNNGGEIPLCSNQIAIMNESLDGSNLENTLTELVVRFHRVIVDHIYQFQYNSQGAMLLLCDVSEYRKVVSELNIPIAKKLFVTLHALCNLLIVSSDHLLSACSSNTLKGMKNTNDEIMETKSIFEEHSSAFSRWLTSRSERVRSAGGRWVIPNFGHCSTATVQLRKCIFTRAIRLIDALLVWSVKWHLIPFLILVGYSLLGGCLFHILEGGPTIPKLANRSTRPYILRARVHTAADYQKEATLQLWRILGKDVNDTERWQQVQDTWIWYNSKALVPEAAAPCPEFQLPKPPKLELNFWTSVYYAVTVYTTIGYGDIVPRTTGGKIFTMIYCLFGIPLLFYILEELGTMLLKMLHCILRWLKLAFNRPVLHRYDHCLAEVPLSVALLLQIIWLCTSAALFLLWEDEWDYFTSFYFFFISFTTIGLGDVVPKYPSYTLMCSILVLLGLALVSMTVSVVQQKIDLLFQLLMNDIEHEYRKRQVDPGTSKLSFGKRDDMLDELRYLCDGKPLQSRILFKVMGKSKRDLLLQSYVKKASTRNIAVQTVHSKFKSVSCQTPRQTAEPKSKTNRKYVFKNSTDPCLPHSPKSEMKDSSVNDSEPSVESSVPEPGSSTETGEPKKRYLTKELRCMLYGFGDSKQPFAETVDLLEDIVMEFIKSFTLKSMEVRKTGRITLEDIWYLIRRDPKKYSRVKDLLTMNEELRKARKAFDEAKY
ncbi:Exocyst complex component 5 [Trichinella britovi]|uniref:Exocyst complex component 5 n=2 Tax=Trichinella britovi TaxID=45882 RepID=A0A0V1CH71_TRIBR|nr:Exocyst complex component 5 [Trichinella britovi]